MNWLLFTLAAPLASFGRAGPVEMRGSAPLPTRSALLGLLGAALGLRRDDDAGQAALAQSVRFACRVEQQGRLLQDYHTIQTPKQTALKKAPHFTRRNELAFPSDDLATVLSTREYHEDFRATVGIHAEDAEILPRYCDALQRPGFVLYLGRKTCVLSWPLAPQLLQAADWETALQLFDAVRAEESQRWRKAVENSRLSWPLGRGKEMQHAAERELTRYLADPSRWRETMERDEPRDRRRWLFSTHAWLQRTESGGGA